MKITDLSNKRFGRLVALEFISTFETLTAHTAWKCLCDCGKICNIPTENLTIGKTISCGCYRTELAKKAGSNNLHWKGFGDLPKSEFTRIKISATRRNLEFDLSIEFLWNLYLSQEGKCRFTRRPLQLSANSKTRTASLDRIDSSKGYTEESVQWVHKDVNMFKKNLTDSDFISLCREVAVNAQ